MLLRVRAGSLGGAIIYSGLSTSPWKPKDGPGRARFPATKKT